jgi:integrase
MGDSYSFRRLYPGTAGGHSHPLLGHRHVRPAAGSGGDGESLPALGEWIEISSVGLVAMLDWLELRGDEPGRLFVEVNKSGRIGTGQLSGEALRKMLDKRSKQARLSRLITWHDFRRTFVGNLWDAKIDGVTIQKLMGHASQNQTAKYDRRPEAARRAAVKVLHVPYFRK